MFFFSTLEESLEYLLLVKDKKSAMRLIDKIQRREERIIEIDIGRKFYQFAWIYEVGKASII